MDVFDGDHRGGRTPPPFYVCELHLPPLFPFLRHFTLKKTQDCESGNLNLMTTTGEPPVSSPKPIFSPFPAKPECMA